MTGKARSTISKHIRDNRLSVVIDEDGNQKIEASELIRVYGEDVAMDEQGNLITDKRSSGRAKQSASEEGADWKAQLDKEKTERARERGQLESTIEHLRTQLTSSEEREKHTRLLLEDRSKDNKQHQEQNDLWKKKLESLENRVSNQEGEVRKYRRARVEERNKSWWEKLWK